MNHEIVLNLHISTEFLMLNANQLVSKVCHYLKWAKTWFFSKKISNSQFLRINSFFSIFPFFFKKKLLKNFLKVIFVISSPSSIQPCKNIRGQKFLLDFCPWSTLSNTVFLMRNVNTALSDNQISKTCIPNMTHTSFFFFLALCSDTHASNQFCFD